MLLFLDTEFTDFTERELISIGMVSEDGRHELYLEIQDFDRDKCNSFVRQTVWAELGQISGATVKRSEVAERIRQWFVTLPRSVRIASDSQHDRELLADALGGEWPKNLAGWLDLRPMIELPCSIKLLSVTTHQSNHGITLCTMPVHIALAG